MRTIMDKARASMAAYYAPKHLWGQAILHAVYTFNCTHCPRDHDKKTPYELVFGHAPDISELVPFYAPGVFHTTDTQMGAGTSYKYKAEACRLLGYSEVSKNTYVVLLVNSNYIAERTDCHFNEDLYEKKRSVKNLPDKESEDVIQFLHNDDQFEPDLERLIDHALADDKATQTDSVPTPPAPVTTSSNHVPTITAPPANTDIPAASDAHRLPLHRTPEATPESQPLRMLSTLRTTLMTRAAPV